MGGFGVFKKNKPNTTLPLAPVSKTALEIIYLLDKETYLKSTEIFFSLPKMSLSLRPDSVYSEVTLAQLCSDF